MPKITNHAQVPTHGLISPSKPYQLLNQNFRQKEIRLEIKARELLWTSLRNFIVRDTLNVKGMAISKLNAQIGEHLPLNRLKGLTILLLSQVKKKRRPPS